MSRFKIDFFLILLIVFADDEIYQISDFRRKWYQFFNMTPNGLKQIDIGIESYNVTPLFFNDLNQDRYTDMAVISEDKKKVQFYLYDNDKGKFIGSANTFVAPNSQTIENFVITDISLDIIPDAYVTFNYPTNIKACQGYANQLYQCGNISVEIMNNTQPLVFDINLDYSSDVLVTLPDGTRAIFNGSDFNLGLYRAIPFSTFVSNKSSCKNINTFYPFSIPHFNSYIDLNGDCLSDLFITSYDSKNKIMYYEIWLRDTRDDENIKFCLTTFDTFSNLGVNDSPFYISFEDFDKDGGQDLVLTYQDKSQNYILSIFHNAVVPEEQNNYGSTELCTTFLFNNNNLFSRDSTKLIILDGNLTFPVKNLRFSPFAINDFSKSGYPTIVMPLLKKDLKIYAYKITIFPSNLTFSVDTISDLGTNIISANYFDFDENGKLGFIVKKTEGKSTKLSYYYNNILTDDGMYLKIMALQRETFGGIQMGATMQFMYTNIDSSKSIASGTQMFQTAYNALMLPYKYYGIERSSNYFEIFTISYGQKGNSPQFTPIIPNSQLKLYPKSNNEISIDQLINPSQAIQIAVFLEILIFLILIIILVCIHLLEIREKRRKDRIFIASRRWGFCCC